jgi:hypothetical protein
VLASAVLARAALGRVAVGAPVPGGPDAIRRAARAVLSRPEFQPTPESPTALVRRWTLDQLGRLLSAALGGSRFGILGGILALAVVGALVIMIVLAVRGTGANPVLAGGFAVSGGQRPTAAWLADAAALEAAGDWRGALRCRYRALVAELAQRGLVDEIPGRTTGEYRRQLASTLPRSADDFSGVTDLFERAWYGDAFVTEAEAARLRALAERVRAGAR